MEPKLALVSTSEGGMVLPFYERQWDGTTDICTWLSVSGAKLWGDPRSALLVWQDHARQSGWVAGYIQVEPCSLLPKVDGAVVGNAVFLVNLNQPDPLVSASQGLRRNIRQTESSGVVLVDDRPALADALVRIYPTAMERIGASPAYELPEAALRDLAHAEQSVVLGASYGDCVDAIVVAPYSQSLGEYFIGATTLRGRKLTAWLLSQVITKLRHAGVPRFNLGGGVNPHDGLAEFKRRFGGDPKTLGALCQVYDLKRYSSLTSLFSAKSESRWFPAYRDALTC